MIDLKKLITDERALGKNPASLYTAAAFQAIDEEVLKITDDEKKSELRDEARAMLEENKDVLALNYVAGRIFLEIREHEYNMRLNNLLLTFYEAGNWEVSKHIGNLILSKGESSKALRVLGDIADTEGREIEKWAYYERLIKADSSDHEIILKYADHSEELGDKKLAMAYYQRAFTRLLNTPDDPKLYEVFQRLISNGRSEYPFYSNALNILSGKDKYTALALFKELLKYNTKVQKGFEPGSSEYERCLDNSIDICRQILVLDSDSPEVRTELVSILKTKHKDAARLKECLKSHNLETSPAPVKTLDDFEKDISYAKGSYVIFTRNKRVGLISEVKKDSVLVKLSSSESQTIPLKTAFEILQPISKTHIKAIKKGVPPQKIKAKINSEGGIEWLVRTLLYSALPRDITLKDMKDELVPAVLTDAEWKSINEKVKKELRSNSYIKIIPGSTDSYLLTAYPLTPEEKLNYMFMNTQPFYSKVDLLLKTLDDKTIDKSSDSIMTMVSWFQDKLASDKTTISDRIASSLVLDLVSEKGLAVQFDVSFETLYPSLSSPEKRKEVFSQIENNELKKEFVDHVIVYDRKAAPATLVELFPYYIATYIPNKLRTKRLLKSGEFYNLVRNSFDFFRDNIPSFHFLFTKYNLTDEELKTAGVDKDKIVKTELMALSYATRNNLDKKYAKDFKKDLLDGRKLYSYIDSVERSEVESTLALVLSNDGLEREEKAAVKSYVVRKYPELAGFGVSNKPARPVQKEAKVVTGFLCTQASYERKKAELKQKETDDMIAINREISNARELGDLRENAEYQYAKEHKRDLEREITELTKELGKVRVMRMSDVLPGLVGFGTKIVLHDYQDGKDHDYTFMGRWESDPDHGVFDISAPLGQHLMNHKAGDEVAFESNGRECRYKVVSIEPVEF